MNRRCLFIAWILHLLTLDPTVAQEPTAPGAFPVDRVDELITVLDQRVRSFCFNT